MSQYECTSLRTDVPSISVVFKMIGGIDVIDDATSDPFVDKVLFTLDDV